MSASDYLNLQVGSINSSFSGGQLQRISLIRALTSDKDVIVLDEPTNGLDHRSKLALISCLREVNFNKIVIIVSHDLIFNSEEFKVIDIVDSQFVVL